MAHDHVEVGLAASTEMQYLHAGEGRPVVLIHGWPTGGAVWDRQLLSLAPVAHVIAPDLPGYGGSPARGVTSVAGLAQALHRFLQELDLDNAVIVGWSLGGGIVMSYLDQFGAERVVGAAIVDDCPCLLPRLNWELGRDTTFDPAGLQDWVDRWTTSRGSVIHELNVSEFCQPAAFEDDIRRLDALSMRADPQAALAGLLDAFSCDFRDSLAQITVPVLLLYGGRSKLTTQAAREFMLAEIPTARLHVFENSGHNPFIEEQEEFDEVLATFMNTT